MSVMLEGATTGPKVNMLKKVLPQIKDGKAKQLATEACKKMQRLIGKRNHVIHGMWARHLITPQKQIKPGCLFMRFKDDPIFPDELRKLANQGAQVTRCLGDLLVLLVGSQTDIWTEPRKFFVTDRDTSELGWFAGDKELSAMSYSPQPGR